MGRLDSKELNPTKNQTAVGATETKVILQSVFNLDIARGIGAIVQIAFGILVVQVDGGRHFLMVQRQHCEHTLNATSTTQQVAGHGLGRTDECFIGMITHGSFDGVGFIHIAQRRGSSMGIQITNLI